MLSPKYQLYFSRDREGRLHSGVSVDPALDGSWLAHLGAVEMVLLQPHLPLGLAERILAESSANNIADPERAARRSLKLIRESWPQIKPELERLPCVLVERVLDSEGLQKLERLLTGRSLLLTEITGLMAGGMKIKPDEIEALMQYLVSSGKVERQAAVGINRLGFSYCRRCGSRDGISEDRCYFCGSGGCYTCSNCRELGIAKSCIPLYSKAAVNGFFPMPAIQARLDFKLTPAQQRAAAALEEFGAGSGREFLVWAVCGAGKTEVSFGLIARVLAAGRRVLYAIPRRDVVQELLPRFQRAFPDIEIGALYGGSNERISDARLVLATTHQAIRLYCAFDLVVLDEADAFPYQGSDMLHFAVRRALTETGQMLIMTATPEQETIRQARSGKLPYMTIPARYHRRPLIMPEFWKINSSPPANGEKKWEPHPRIANFLAAVKMQGRRVLIFLPTLPLVEAYGVSFQHWGKANGIQGEWVHARHGNRLALKEELREGRIDFLVTSTVFERGLTIPNVDILVLMADFQRVFDIPTLVQIAGRAGREGETAQVVFAARQKTPMIRGCCDWIDGMNREGYALGFLD